MSKQNKILIVDDDLDLLQMMGLVLSRAGFQVLKADDGLTGLQIALDTMPDLVISDVMMPNMDGMEMCRRLRSQPQTRHIPLILLSALGDTDNVLKGFQMGADDYVSKPVNPKELVARVTAVLNRASITRPMAAHSISFVGAKGGVGTTTVAMNVAARLAQLEHTVVYVELQPFGGGLRYLLRFREAMVDYSALLTIDPARIKRPEVERCLLPHSSGMQVMLSPIISDRTLTPEHVEAVFDVLSLYAHFIIFDIPAQPDAAMRRAMALSDQVLLVTEAEEFSTASAAAQLRRFKHWGVFERTNLVGVERVPFATSLNRAEIENKAGVTVLEHQEKARWDPREVDLNAHNRQRVVTIVPSAPNLFHETVRDRVPLIMVDPNSKPSNAYLDLIDWLMDRRGMADSGGGNRLNSVPPEAPPRPNVSSTGKEALSYMGGMVG